MRWNLYFKKSFKESNGNKRILRLVAIECSLNFGFLLFHNKLLFWNEREVWDFSLTNMLGLRKGRSHTTTLKPPLTFYWIWTTKWPFHFYVCIQHQESKKKVFGKIHEILFFQRCTIPLGQFPHFLGIFLLMIHPSSSDVSFFF